jgi:Tol biopolymer transport system component/DNA-binding winged helix-turn-helix (wHTH) protein
MEASGHSPRLVRFATFEVDLHAGELRKSGLRLKLTGQPFQVLAILLESPGEVVTREELQKRLWPDTFVDVDHNLNTAINKIREVLGDSAENPRFVETLPRRGYRFVASVEGVHTTEGPGSSGVRQESRMVWIRRTSILFVVLVLLAAVAFFIFRRSRYPASLAQRTLTRLTFDDGLQIGATWSPDGRFIAYSSNRGGKFDIWVQQVSGGDPVQITKGPGHNWQPDWSPDGRFIAYRSENGEGELFVIPALGGAGLERKLASFGYYPRWSPNGSQILFQTSQFSDMNRFYVVGFDEQAREVLTEFFTKHPFLSTKSAAWHPDGKRISVWVWSNGPLPTFWTVPVAGGDGVKSELDPQIARQFADVSMSLNDEMLRDFKFSWAPSGKAICFERTFRGVRNLWRMMVDPESLRAQSIERLTTGSGLDTELALSADGKRLAFTAETDRVQAKLFPFDGIRGRITGSGQAATSPGMEAWQPNLSRDGKKLAFVAQRTGKWELWEKSFVDGREVPIAADDYFRYTPTWSPDGTHLAYGRLKSAGTRARQLLVWSAESRDEQALTAPNDLAMYVYDWSSDGKKILGAQEASSTSGVSPSQNAREAGEIWLWPAEPFSSSKPSARKIISDPEYDLYQAHFSPDGQWIVFEAIRSEPTLTESTLYVTAAAGGPWIRITDGKHWDDKPRWSPDGQTIYFISSRGGFANVWAVHFDPINAKALAEPFRVTTFESPRLMVPKYIPAVELSLTKDKLVLTMEELSGSIWVLDNVGP